MTTRTLKHYDYKYEPRLWRKDVEEAFQTKKKVETLYTVVDGQVVQTVETLWEFASAKAARSVQLPDPPGGTSFVYIDGSYRADPAYVFQKTHVKTTTFEAYGDAAYIARIEDLDVLANTITREVRIIDGKIPLAPTQNSALTTLVQQPITGVLDDNCDYVPGTTTVSGGYLEDATDGSKAARRALQRATAIVRKVRHGANPLMKIGQTIRLIDPKRGIDARHVLVGRTIELTEEGGANEMLELEFWIR